MTSSATSVGAASSAPRRAPSRGTSWTPSSSRPSSCASRAEAAALWWPVGRQLEGLACQRRRHRLELQAQWPHAQRAALRPHLPAAAAHRRTNALQQLTHAEGLGHVVVGAQLEAQHLVGLGGARGGHQDGYRALLAQPSTHREAVDARQHEVENHRVEDAPGGGREGCFAIGDMHHLDVTLLEELAREGREALVVFDQQHAHP